MANKIGLPELDCLVLGGGPSTPKFLKSYIPDLAQLPRIGCGDVGTYCELDYYCLGDPRRKKDAPKNNRTIIYAHHLIWEPGMIKFPDNLPHGGSSGGMAVSIACLNYDNVGLIGFDGFNHSGFENYDDFVACFKTEIIDYWTSKGKNLYSLMDDSIFNEFLLEYKY